jgi:hypothetical protein
MSPEFQYYNRKTKKTNLQSFSDCRLRWSKEPQWENDCGSFLPCFLLVFVSLDIELKCIISDYNQGHIIWELRTRGMRSSWIYGFLVALQEIHHCLSKNGLNPLARLL